MRHGSTCASDAVLTDDCNRLDHRQRADTELFGQYRCHVDAIDREEDNGTLIYSDFHPERWWDFKTFWKFTLETGKITRRDVGEA